MRTLLRPGVHLLRRGADEWQVGTDARSAVVLADDAHGESLHRLSEGSACSQSEEDGALVTELGRLRLLISARLAHTLLPDRLPPAVRHDRAAVAALDGDGAEQVLRRRTTARVTLDTFGGVPGELLGAEAGRLLDLAGVPVGEGPTTLSGPHRGGRRRPAVDLGLLVGVGEPDRDRLDPLVQHSVPHLLLRSVAGSVVVGPLVLPGRTACLRCLDAHHADVDPSWPLLVHQYAARDGADRADGVPEPLDVALAAVGVGWLVRDAVSFLEGRPCPSHAGTTRFDPALAEVEHRTWPAHPRCGCGWEGAADDADVPRATPA